MLLSLLSSLLLYYYNYIPHYYHSLSSFQYHGLPWYRRVVVNTLESHLDVMTCHDVLNHRLIDFWSNNLFRPTTRKHQSSVIPPPPPPHPTPHPPTPHPPPPLWGKSISHRWIVLTKGQYCRNSDLRSIITIGTPCFSSYYHRASTGNYSPCCWVSFLRPEAAWSVIINSVNYSIIRKVCFRVVW